MIIRRKFFGLAALAPAMAAVFAILCWSSVAVAAPKVLIWDADWLEEVRERTSINDPAIVPAVKQLRHDADRALDDGPFSVVDKKQTPPSGDKHDYMSLGPYWWPNPDTADGLPYVRRDGERYPGIRDISDRSQLGELSNVMQTLALAYYYTGDDVYAERAALLIRTWFLDPTTRMNPHLRYGQAIRGINEGRGIGIIETRMFANVLDAVGLLAESATWTETDQRKLVAWFEAYLKWLLESKLGRDECAAENNHGTYYDVQVASFASFVGKDDVASDVLRDVGPRRIAVQIEPDGSQPLELKRTNAWSYSIGNLKGLMTLARMGEHFNIDIWNYETTDGRSILAAIDFLVPYGIGDRPWEYRQIGGWSADSFHPILGEAAIRYPEGTYRDHLDAIPARALSSRSNLLQPSWQAR